MPFDWREYLNLAQFLFDNADKSSFSEQSALRSAVSRAYYAAFCYARDYAQAKQGFMPDFTAEDHTRIRIHFEQKQMINMADRLDRLRHWRNQCDYRNEAFRLRDTAKDAVALAIRVIDGLK